MNLLPTVLMISIFSFSITGLILGIIFHKQNNTAFSKGAFLVTLSLFLNYLTASIIILLVNLQGGRGLQDVIFKIFAIINYGTSFFFVVSIFLSIFALMGRPLFTPKTIVAFSSLLLIIVIIVLFTDYINRFFPFKFWEGDMTAAEFLIGSISRILLTASLIPLLRWDKKKDKRIILFYLFILLTWGKFISGLLLNVYLRSFFEFLLSLYVILTINVVLFLSFFQHKHRAPSQDGRRAFEDYLISLGVSHREKEIANLLLDGGSYKEIAQELHITTHTVKKHSSRIYAKTKTKDRYALYQLYLSKKR